LAQAHALGQPVLTHKTPRSISTSAMWLSCKVGQMWLCSEDKSPKHSARLLKSKSGASAASTGTQRHAIAVARLIAVALNSAVLLGTYCEYLWAADWVDECAQRTCAPPTSLFDITEGLRLYTFSDSMIRGNNLVWFSVVGTMAAVVYIWVERRRIESLEADLKVQLALMAPKEDTAKVRWSLQCLMAYKLSILSGFVFVLLLVPCHIDRPELHYPLAGALFALMAVAMTSYLWMPLDFGPAATTSIRAWNERRCRTISWVRLLCFVQVAALFAGITRITAVITASEWSSISGRLFGLLEVAVILGYQIFVALFAFDDIHIATAS